MDRRRWLRVAGGAAALALGSSCASASSSRFTDRYGRRVAPALVSEDRVIREVTGLRPYRANGFVLRAERFAGKLLVHNYGHGGGGVTLSWGTAHMAADEVTQASENGDVAVLGAGAVGLATALLLQRRGRSVTIYAKDLPPNTTSNIAGAQWSPTSVADDISGSFAVQFQQAARLAYGHFQELVGAGYGVRWIDNYFLSEAPLPLPSHVLATPELYPELQDLEGSQHPFPTRYARRVATMFIEPPRYLRALLRDFRLAGGQIRVGEITGRVQLAELVEPVIVNCTGLGSGALFGDSELIPIKGQLVVLRPQPEVSYLTIGTGRFGGQGSTYMFPRSDGLLLGGTFDRGNFDLSANPLETARIVAAHVGLFGAMGT